MKILQRKRMEHRLGMASEKTLTLACAPMGYGKTTALHDFLEKQGAYMVWFSMEGELDGEWVWRKLQKAIQAVLGRELTVCNKPIPKNRIETEVWIQEVGECTRETLHIVLDDFEWGSCNRMEDWITFYSHEIQKKICLWVISRESPKGRMLELSVKHKAETLSIQDFSFLPEDIKQLSLKEDIILKKEDVDFVFHYTNGWVAAIQLVLASYKANGNFYNLSTLDFLMEAAFYNNVEEQLKGHLMRLSILKDFTLEQAEYLCGDREIVPFLIQMVRKHNFAYKISQTKYRIAPVLNEMLKRELLQSDMDINDLYRRGGDWFAEKEEHLEAIRQYMYCGDYGSIFDVLAQCEDESLMDTAPELIMSVFKRVPDNYSINYPYIYMKWIMDVITNVDIREGQDLLEQYYIKIKSGKARGNINMLLGEYYFAMAFTRFNDARSMHEYFMKAYQSFEECGMKTSKLAYPLMVDTFGSNHMLYLYHNQPGDLRGLVEDINEKTKYFTGISGGVNRGMESQTAAEYAFETGDYLQAEELAIASFIQAEDGGRTSISICSLFLRGRLGVLFKNWELYYKMLDMLEEQYNNAENPIIQCEADLARGYLYGLTDQRDKISEWIRDGRSEKSALLPEAAMTFYITHGLSLFLSDNYKGMLAVGCLMEHTYENRMHVFGLIYAYIFKTIGVYRLHGLEKAEGCIRELLELCGKDHIVTPLVEFRNPLSEILEAIAVKGPFVKEVTAVFDKFDTDRNLQKNDLGEIILTKKEEEVMQHLILGKTGPNIAQSMEISLNTVQTHMKSIYRKYGVNTKIDVIRAYENSRKL